MCALRIVQNGQIHTNQYAGAQVSPTTLRCHSRWCIDGGTCEAASSQSAGLSVLQNETEQTQ